MANTKVFLYLPTEKSRQLKEYSLSVPDKTWTLLSIYILYLSITRCNTKFPYIVCLIRTKWWIFYDDHI